MVDSCQRVNGGEGWVLSHIFIMCDFVFWSLMSCLFFKVSRA